MTLDWTAWWPTALLAATLGITAWSAPRDVELRARWPWELALAVASGLWVCLAGGHWLVDFALVNTTWSCSDFYEYCSSVDALRRGVPEEFSHQRSILAALPAALWAQDHGIVDGLAFGATLSGFLLGAALYGWGRAIAGPGAGVAAAVLSTSLTPLLILPRTLSFYPEATAVFALGAAGAALALRGSSPLGLLAGGLGAGLCFLIDGRGLFWGLSFLGLSGLAALLAHPRRWPMNLTLVLLPIGLSWRLGAWAYQSAFSLEMVMNLHMRMQERGLTQTTLRPPMAAPGSYIWGLSDPLSIPATLKFLSEESAKVPSAAWNNLETLDNLQDFVFPLAAGALGAALLALLHLTRGEARWRRLAALAGTCVPFVAALSGAIQVQYARPHYLANAWPALALLLGLGLSALVDGLPRPVSRPEGWRRWLRPVLVAALAGVLALSTWSSPLSPTAPGRDPLPRSDQDLYSALRRAAAHNSEGLDEMRARCVNALEADAAAGITPGGTLYGGTDRHSNPGMQTQ